VVRQLVNRKQRRLIATRRPDAAEHPAERLQRIVLRETIDDRRSELTR